MPFRAVLSYSSWRGDGNPNLKGCKAGLFQQREDKRSALQAQCDAKGDNHSPPPSSLPLWGLGAGKPPSQTIKLHPFQGCSLHRSRKPHLRDREGTTHPRRYNTYLTTSKLHAGATRWPTALGRRSRTQGSRPLALPPAATTVSPSDQCTTAIPLRSGSLSQIEITQHFSSSYSGYKGGRGGQSWKLPGKRRWAKPPCSEAKDKHVTWLSNVYVCVIAIYEYWKARRKSFWLGQSV